jgi:hypothetical protein
VDSTKSTRTHYTKLVFLPPMGLRVTKCILVRPGPEMSMHYFSCSGGPDAISIKSVSGHVTPNLCFCIR